MKHVTMAVSAAVVACGLLGGVLESSGAIYYGNAYAGDGSGGPINGGTLTLTDNGTTVFATINKGNGTFGNSLVIYLDTGSGGFVNTSTFMDNGSPLRTTVSGFYNDTTRSTVNFASGFTADYAISIGAEAGDGLFRLASGGSGSLELIKSVSLNPSNDQNSPTYTFRFNWSDIGLGGAATKGLRFESTTVYTTGYRYLESFESLTGSKGFNTITFQEYDVYGIEPVPEPANLALAVFAGVVVCGGFVFRKWRS